MFCINFTVILFILFPCRNAPTFPLLPLRYHIWYPARWPEDQTNSHFHMTLRLRTSCGFTPLTGHQSVTGKNRALFFKRSWDRATLMYSSTTNKMQHYTIVFITINARHVSDSSSAHHQELKTVYTASGICRAFSASYR